MRPYAKVAGQVYACIPDDSGGWFIGGDFSAVGGEPRANVARIRRDGQVDRWRADTDGRVAALLLDKGTLYIGGLFTQVGGRPRHYLAAVTAARGAVRDWKLDVSGIGSDYSAVNALLIQDGTMYIGGDFAVVGGQNRQNLAALDLASGCVLDFAPEPDDRIYALAVKESTLYVGGEFYAIGGQERPYLAALNAGTGEVQSWDARMGSARYDYDVLPYVCALVPVGSRLYVAGHFTRAGGQVRGGIAALDLASGDATDWNPRPVSEAALSSAPFVYVVTVRDSLAYIGGRFTDLGTKSRFNLGAVSLTTGLATDFDPRVSADVHAVALCEGVAYAGGEFTTLWDWQIRNGLAAIDLDSGELLPWNPDLGGGYVMALAADRHAVYIGGRFSRINGEQRSGIAALDPVSGILTSWNPGCNGSVNVLATSGGIIYVGGYFTSVAGLPRRFIAALDSGSGTPTAWDPGADYIVQTIVPSGSSVYVGGGFDMIGGQPRRGIAELDAASGLATPWNPQTDATIKTIAVARDVVYVGGMFWQIGGAARTALAALDRLTGLATDWNPDPGESPFFPGAEMVSSLILSDGVVYVAGDFGRIGGAERYFVAALDTATAKAMPWNPGAFGGIVTSLVEYDNTIYMGGALTRLGRSPVGFLGGCTAVSPQLLPTPSLALGQCFPNPAVSSTTIPFVLSAAASIALSVYDLQGRLVATPLRDEQRPAGLQHVSLNVGDLPVGCYLYRLEVGGESATRKMLVLK